MEVGAQVLTLIDPQNLERLKTQRDWLLRWLREDALPLWETHGIDREFGGYFESVEFDPERRAFRARGEVRRGRVVARQIYVFHTGRALGWSYCGTDPLLHGCEYLFSHMKRGDGHFHTAIHAGSRHAQGDFSLYEAAFYLFALAKIHETGTRQFPVYETAADFLGLLRRGWGRSNGGFDESRPVSLPLKSNPHMHLLEAALAWVDATAADPSRRAVWAQLAAEIVTLALLKFVDASRGALREFFDAAWAPMPGEQGRLVEPGHQFEWAWLLLRWAAHEHSPAAQRPACRRAAAGLMVIGERFGVDPVRGVAFDELWDDMTPKEASAKLWPQTERVKAWCAVLQGSTSRQEADEASRSLCQAVLGMRSYLSVEPPGLWRERMLADGTFAPEASKASSFYHIVGAIDTLDRLTLWT